MPQPMTEELIRSKRAFLPQSRPHHPWPFLDSAQAPIIVDGLVYDVCSLLDVDSVTAIISPEVDIRPQVLYEVASVSPSAPAFREGSVACTATTPFDQATGSVGQALLEVWSDDSVAFALTDPAMTSNERVTARHAARRTAEEAKVMATVFTDLPDGSWADYYVYEGVNVGVGRGGVFAQLTTKLTETCWGDDAAAQACMQQQIATVRPVASAFLDGVLAVLTAQGGTSAEWPTMADPEPLVYDAPAGPVDLCATAEAAFDAVAPNQLYTTTRSTSFTNTLTTGDVVSVKGCVLDPIDREVAHTVTVLLPDMTTGTIDAYIADARSMINGSETPPAVGDESFVSMGYTTWVHQSSQWFGFQLMPLAGTSTIEDDIGINAIIEALLPTL